MKNGEIYKFEDPHEIFVHVFHSKTKRNPLFSIRAFARKLGFRNPSHVADVLNGRRNLTVDFALRVSDELELNEEEKTYFETLVFAKNAKSPQEESYYRNVLHKFRPDDDKKPLPTDNSAYIKEWYYGVIDEMTCLSDFRADPQYLAKRLGPSVTPQAASIALADLIRLGSLEKGAKGKLVRPRRAYYKIKEAKDEMEDTALRKYQRQHFEKGLLALDDQTKGESYFRMSNIAIKAKHFEDFRNLVEEFVQKANSMESAKDADDVYLLAVQFCRLTERSEN